MLDAVTTKAVVTPRAVNIAINADSCVFYLSGFFQNWWVGWGGGGEEEGGYATWFVRIWNLVTDCKANKLIPALLY